MPILVLGDDTALRQMKTVEPGADEYLLKHRLDADTLMRALHSSIARKARGGAFLRDRKFAQLNISSIVDGVLSSDNAGLITFLNPAAERLIGWTEAIGRHVLEAFQFVEATTRERVMPRMESKVQKARMTISLANCLLVRRDGHESPIEEHAELIYDRSSHISGMAVVFHDLIELRAMAHKLTDRAAHDVFKHLPIRVLSDNRPADAPTQSEPVESRERRWLLSFGQHRWPWRLSSPAPRAFS